MPIFRCVAGAFSLILATGVGGRSLTYLNMRSKTGPIFSVKSPMYFSKVPSKTVKKPRWVSASGTK
jgi:hypothetical protein